MIYVQHLRAELSLDDQTRYDALVQAFKGAERRVEIPLPYTESMAAVEAARLDHPELFYYGPSYRIQGDRRCTVYEFDRPHDTAYYLGLVKKIKALFARDIDPMKDKGEYEKVLFVHDYLAKRVKYDKSDPDSFTVIGPLLLGHGACQGIALAALFLLQYLGVKAFFVGGKLKKGPLLYEDHGWNAVEVEGKWCYLDVTAALDGGYPYFLVDERTLRRTHRFASPRLGHGLKAKAMDFDHPEMEYHARMGTLFSSFEKAGECLAKNLRRPGDRLSLRLNRQDEEDHAKEIVACCRNPFPRGVEYSFHKERQTYFFTLR